MIASDVPTKVSPVDRRLQATGMPIEGSIAVLGDLILLVADAWGLSLIPLLGASAALPLVYALLRARGTDAKRVTRGIGILTAAAGVGVAVAYLLSGLIIQANGSVRTVFWVISILAALSLAVAWFYLPDSHHRQTEPIDWGGAIGVSVGLV